MLLLFQLNKQESKSTSAVHSSESRGGKSGHGSPISFIYRVWPSPTKK